MRLSRMRDLSASQLGAGTERRPVEHVARKTSDRKHCYFRFAGTDLANRRVSYCRRVNTLSLPRDTCLAI